jgi:hypothetical protein
MQHHMVESPALSAAEAEEARQKRLNATVRAHERVDDDEEGWQLSAQVNKNKIEVER